MVDIRSMIADDHPQITAGLSFALASYGIVPVATVNDGVDVVPKYLETRPDVLVLDLRLGSMGGLDVARDLLEHEPDANIVFYSQFDQDHIVQEAYRIGGKGFVTKNMATAVLADAIKTVHQGGIFCLPEIDRRLAILGGAGEQSPATVLSPEEMEVFKRLIAGRDANAIGQELGMSEKKATMLANSIKASLGVTKVAQLQQMAAKHGIEQAAPHVAGLGSTGGRDGTQ